jgi:tRNA A-37 threonylcarbamoyl transferase component Bud32
MSIVNIQRWDRLIRCQENYYSEAMRILLDSLDQAIHHAPVLLKKGNSSTVVKLLVNEEEIVVKRANLRNHFHALRRLFQPSRAKKNWDYAKRLQSINVQTFEPIAMVEKRWGPFRRESYFISNFLTGKDLWDCFVNAHFSDQEKNDLAREVIKLIKKLASAGLYHRDLNLSNIFFMDNQLYIIDLDSMQRYKKSKITTFLLTLKIWYRFLGNVEDTVGKDSIIARIFREAYRLEKMT